MNRSLLFAVLIVAFASIGFAQEDGESVEDRLKPFGNLCMEGDDCGGVQELPTVTEGTRTALEIYNKHCFACHATGVSEAPLVAADTWLPRLEKGMDVLLENTRKGFNVVMPPMGTCMDCTDDEFIETIEYMITGKTEDESEDS